MRETDRRVAYFTMEVALEDSLPTYSGGLGVLAGDYLRSAADLELPIVAVSLLYRGGYFRQVLDDAGRQSEQPVDWEPAALLTKLADVSVEVDIEERAVVAAAWRYEVVGETGWRVPVYFLDSDVPENKPEDRAITDQLYSGDQRHRLAQEALLGIGGVDLLRRLGVDPRKFHMNEGHSSLLTLRLCELLLEAGLRRAEVLEEVRRRCVFTTHTPVPAGHDRFGPELLLSTLGPARADLLEGLGLVEPGRQLNMTDLGAACSRFVNAVSRRHRSVTQAMLPEADVTSVTNGVHAARWAAPSVASMFDEHVPGWRRDSALLRYASGIPLDEVDKAHAASKSALLEAVAARTGEELDPRALTIGLARRVTPYKQSTLLFSDLDRLRSLVDDLGPIQVVCAGKAHPRDEPGKALIEQMVEAARELGDGLPVVFVENYDLTLAGLLCAGADVWLNTPAKPQEASGTSGMKAALNGVPSLSVLDGWWIEGWIEGVTGWSIGSLESERDSAEDLYSKLEDAVLPLFYSDPAGYAAVRRNAISLNGSFFSTDRMAREYAQLAYGL